MMQDPFPPAYFRRQDEHDDNLFYSYPRLVVHIDDHAIGALTDLYRRLLMPESVVLDLMSSWRSHLPAELNLGGVIGLGMNPVEMAQNPQLDRYVVHDLNAFPQLPFEADRFDAALCAVSVQYLVQPLAVFREVNRVLKPGGVFIVSFSNRCFPSKAIAAWLAATDEEHVTLVKRYLEHAGHWADTDSMAVVGEGHNPLFAVWARKPR